MKITWSVPVPSETLESGRGDLVRAAKLIGAVRGAGHDVVVVAAGSQSGARAAVSAYRSVVRRLLPRIVGLALRDIGRMVHARTHARRVARAARAQGANLIIETQVHLSGSGAGAARACRLPLLLDDCSPPGEERTLGGGLSALARGTFTRQATAASVMTVSSAELRDRLVDEGISASKIVVVSNGVDVASYESASRDAARQHFGLGTAPTLGFVGSFQPWHRVDLLVEAMAGLIQDPPPHLILAGEGPGLHRALEVAGRSGISQRVHALGALPPAQIPMALAACDIGVLPGSNDYGQPMKLLEYAAAGLAIVAPDLPPVRALLQDGVTGLLFTPGDSDSLRGTLARLLGDRALRLRLGTEARNRIALTADWREQGRELAAIAERFA